MTSPAVAPESPRPGVTDKSDPDIQQMLEKISLERIQRSIYVLSSFKTRHTLSDPSPSGDGIGGAASWIRAEFERAAKESGGRLKVEIDDYVQPVQMPRIAHPVQIKNLYATLEGSRPDAAGRVYVISGHYDSRVTNILDSTSAAPGADDDASGVAAMLELARVMSHDPYPATLIFLAVAGEEQGLVGSAHWAQQAKEKGLQIAGVFNNDIIGSSRSDAGLVDRRTVRVFAEGIRPTAHPDEALLALLGLGGENDTAPRELARSVRDIAGLYMPQMNIRVVYRLDRYRRSGDHGSFLSQGFPAIRFTEPAEDFRYQHQDVRNEKGIAYGDTSDHVDFAYVAAVTRVNAACLAALARAPASPSVEVESANLENDTTLRWIPNAEPDLAGYRVVWRETTAPFWEHFMDLPPSVHRYTVKGVNKDNVIFGLEAYDTGGHVSPASFPTARTGL